MKKIKYTPLIILTIALFMSFKANAQKFWNLTGEFWGGPKTGIALVDDSIFIIGTTTSVMRSTNECNQLEIVLHASEINTIFVSKDKTIFAGGRGKVFFSNNLGISWDSVSVNTSYPLKQFAENSYGELFAITGIYYDGDGVFFSGDNGLTWSKRNNGLHPHLSCDKIAIDKNGRLYLAISYESLNEAGGLYISETSGLMWQKIPIGIDSINTSVKVFSTTNISILSNDTVYLSIYGSSKNFGFELNIYKSIHDIYKNNLWNILDLSHSTVSGMDDAMNSIYIAKNGDWYSSTSGTISEGGTYYSKDGKNWYLIDYGLGSDFTRYRNEQLFVETPNGRIFMIQMLDERIYTTDNSIITGTPIPIESNYDVKIFPNPVFSGEKINVQIDELFDFAEISIYDLTGKKYFFAKTYRSPIELDALLQKGIYIIEVISNGAKKVSKVVVT